MPNRDLLRLTRLSPHSPGETRAADASLNHPGTSPNSLATSIASLRRIQECPPRQLTRADEREVQGALAALRAGPGTPPHLRLPDSAWALFDQVGGDAGLEMLYARRIIAQLRHQELHGRVPLANLIDTARSAAKLAKASLGKRLLRSRYHSWYLQIVGMLPNQMSPGFQEYERWQERENKVASSPELLRRASEAWLFRPRISILMAVRNTKLEWLKEAVQSIRDQAYENWELCVCDDDSEDPKIHNFLSLLPEADSRIVMTLSAERLGESGAFNRSAQMASGEYIACVDHDDRLAPDALFHVVEAMQTADADVLYTDEDFTNEQGARVRPHFKPDWSPTLLESCMYLGHLVVIRRRLFEDIGGFRGEFDGAQDYDLALRATECATRIVHVPRIAYHWRMHPNSVAADANNKPRTHIVGKRALESMIVRRRWPDSSVAGSDVPNLFFLERRLPAPPSVDIIFVSRDGGSARDAANLLRRTDYSPLHVVMAGYKEAASGRVTRALPKLAVTAINCHGQRDPGQLANLGAKAGHGEILVFLNDRLRVVTAPWLEYLVRQVSPGGAGIAGAKILDASGRIEQAGIALGMGDGAGRIGRGVFASPSWLWLDVPREVSAVDFDCLAIRREVFDGLNGFDTSLGRDYQAIDLCLRAGESGRTVIVETRSVLLRNRSRRRTIAPASDWTNFVARWHARLAKPDSFYSPNLRPDREDIQLS